MFCLNGLGWSKLQKKYFNNHSSDLITRLAINKKYKEVGSTQTRVVEEVK